MIIKMVTDVLWQSYVIVFCYFLLISGRVPQPS
jgi:hypothetical protein